MKQQKLTFTVILLLVLTLLLTVPVLAHGDDPEEEHTSTQGSDDDHADESDGHAIVDEASLRNSNTLMVLGGFLGAVFLAGGAGFMFQPRLCRFVPDAPCEGNETRLSGVRRKLNPAE